MALIQIDVGDVISTKEGRTYRVLSVYRNGEQIYKIEGIDDSELTPMRRPVFAHEIGRVLRKALKSDGLKKQEAEAQAVNVVQVVPPNQDEVPVPPIVVDVKKGGK